MERTLGSWRVSVERIPPTLTEVAAMYDAAARRWQTSLALAGYHRAYAGLFARLRAEGRLPRLHAGSRVLDCGIGTAAFSGALVKATGSSLTIAGLDIAPQMLVQARAGLGQVGGVARLCRADARALPYADGRFDLVVSAHMLEHLDDPCAGLRELARVLRPGAALLIVVTRRGPLDALLRLRWRYTCHQSARFADWLALVGLTAIRCYGLGGGPLARRLVVAWLASKAEAGRATAESARSCGYA